MYSWRGGTFVQFCACPTPVLGKIIKQFGVYWSKHTSVCIDSSHDCIKRWPISKRVAAREENASLPDAGRYETAPTRTVYSHYEMANTLQVTSQNLAAWKHFYQLAYLCTLIFAVHTLLAKHSSKLKTGTLLTPAKIPGIQSLTLQYVHICACVHAHTHTNTHFSVLVIWPTHFYRNFQTSKWRQRNLSPGLLMLFFPCYVTNSSFCSISLL